MAAQEAQAADLDTGQATVLGARLDQSRRHEALLARRGENQTVPLSRISHPLAVDDRWGIPIHRSARGRRRLTNYRIADSARPVESRMRGNPQVRFGGRRRGNHQSQD